MQIIRTKEQLREWIGQEREGGQTIALVPTMGALHKGHLSLAETGKRYCSRIIASIFVNPTQFGPKEDFAKYPRTEADDIALLEKAGVAAVYIPSLREMYPEGFTTTITVGAIGNELCGMSRPGHFDGVATVVTKLLLQSLPDIAVFGEKDYQQLHVIRRTVSDLDIPVAIFGAPILREENGLAMSSRNRYLSDGERRIAPQLHLIMQEAAREIREGKEVSESLQTGKKELAAAGFKVDYLELRDADTLASVEKLSQPARLLAAAHLGKTRLIDNLGIV